MSDRGPGGPPGPTRCHRRATPRRCPTTEPIATSRQRLSARVRAVPPSGIRKFFDVIATMPDVISLGRRRAGLHHAAADRRGGRPLAARGRTHYTSNYGTLELRRALAKHLERLYGVSYDPESARSSSPSARRRRWRRAMKAIVDPGDEVLLHEPSYVAYLPAIIFNGGVPVMLPTDPSDGWQLEPSRSRRPSRRAPRCCSWATPATRPAPCCRRRRCVPWRTSRERHDLLVVSDEIYDRLVYGGHRHEADQLARGHARADHPAGRLLEGLRDDRLARRLRLRAAGPARGHRSRSTSTRSCPPRPPPRTPRWWRSPAPSRTSCGWSASTTGGAACSWRAQTASACRRSSRRAPSTPSPDRRHRSHERAVQRAAALRAQGRGHPRQRVRAVRARATSVPRSPPATSISRRPWSESSGSCRHLLVDGGSPMPMRPLVAAFAALVLAFVAIVAAGCQGNVFSLKVGECFTGAASGEVSDVNKVDCAAAHDSEVFSVFDYPNPPSDFPGASAMDTAATAQCTTDFKAYVGIDASSSTLVRIRHRAHRGSWAAGTARSSAWSTRPRAGRR